MKHAIFQLLVAAAAIFALMTMSGCVVDIQVPNSFEFVMYEDCSWEIIETGMGVQLLTGTTGCNDQN